MAKKILKYDYNFMSAAKVGKFGFKKNELTVLARKLPIFNKKLKAKSADPDFSFRQLPSDLEAINLVSNLASQLKRQFANLVVVGIGGSDLGAKAIYGALAGNYGRCLAGSKAMSVHFLGDTTDPQPLLDLLKVIDLKKTVFYIISKSGDTIEPLSSFLFLRKKVIEAVGYKKHNKHFVVTTNLIKGALLEIAQKEDYLVIGHFPGGGRYSVLSVNGLLPAACAGFDIKKLLAGAREIDKLCQSNDYQKNLPFLFAALQYLAYKKRRQNISVIMPYTYNLRDFGFWAKQLLGESLAKAERGFTPIAALGPTDQHSQLQLYIQGPFDKIITFIQVEKTEDLLVPKYNNAEIAYLGGHKFSEILNIEHKATAVSLMKNKRANGTIILPELDEYYLGQLFIFFEMATVYLGELLQINVFNQPGVEQSKKFMYGLLGKKGFEKYKKEILK
jgi:glucose-6-phosphate isomerase